MFLKEPIQEFTWKKIKKLKKAISIPSQMLVVLECIYYSLYFTIELKLRIKSETDYRIYQLFPRSIKIKPQNQKK